MNVTGLSSYLYVKNISRKDLFHFINAEQGGKHLLIHKTFQNSGKIETFFFRTEINLKIASCFKSKFFFNEICVLLKNISCIK